MFTSPDAFGSLHVPQRLGAICTRLVQLVEQLLLHFGASQGFRGRRFPLRLQHDPAPAQLLNQRLIARLGEELDDRTRDMRPQAVDRL